MTIRKTITLGSSEPVFTVEYEISSPEDRALSFVFAVEMCYAMLAAQADDRWYYVGAPDVKLGRLATRVDQDEVSRFGLVDEWQQLDIGLTYTRPAHVWTFPLETVSQSEGGFEAVYQGSVVLGRWPVDLKGGAWTLKLEQSFNGLKTPS